MKDYTLNKKEKETYIKKVKKIKKANTDCYEIEFADGRKFKNIVCSEENIAKITDIQEKQAEMGISRKKKFKNSKQTEKSAMLTSLFFGVMLAAAGTQPTGHGAIPFSVASFACSAVCLKSYVSESSKVKEIEKLEYLKSNREKLEMLKQYRNSLTGLNKNKRNYILKTRDPFSILNIDKFSKKDLEKIMSNIEREEKYGFQYLPKTKIKRK